MGNTKGSKAELEVRNLIRGWWGPYEPTTQIERTPQSGGWHASAGFRVSGDLVFSEASAFPWSVEVKRRERWSPTRFLCGHASPVWDWWVQSERDAAKVDRYPMLWARRGRSAWLVLVPLAQVRVVAGAPPPRFVIAPQFRHTARGVVALPVGYLGADILGTNPAIWT